MSHAPEFMNGSVLFASLLATTKGPSEAELEDCVPSIFWTDALLLPRDIAGATYPARYSACTVGGAYNDAELDATGGGGILEHAKAKPPKNGLNATVPAFWVP